MGPWVLVNASWYKPKDKHSLKVRRKLANLNLDYLETLIRKNDPLT